MRQLAKKSAMFIEKLNSPRAFKGTCYVTKKSCTDGGNPTKKFIFE